MNVVRSLLFLLSAIIFVTGCNSNSARENSHFAASARARIYDREKVEFADAVFYKPNQLWADMAAFNLAPLLFQEIKNNHFESKRFGKLIENGRTVGIDQSIPTVYFRKEKLILKGTDRDQVLFLWFYAQPGKILPQGVRITFDKNEQPAIWEILNDTSGIQQIFVSQFLENLAQAQFGTPLSQRRSSLERSVAETPNFIVSRVISDGPMSMGPAIYLDAEDQDVATLICRCMPAQTKNIISSETYDIVDLSDSSALRLVERAFQSSKISAQHWLNEGAEEMELRLRLPDKF